MNSPLIPTPILGLGAVSVLGAVRSLRQPLVHIADTECCASSHQSFADQER